MRGIVKGVSASLQPKWLKNASLIPLSPSCSFCSQIIKSPSLLSLDNTADDWPSEEVGISSTKEISNSNSFDAKILHGRTIAEGIRSRIAREVRRMKESIGQVPGLGVIFVGQRRDSQTYVRNKAIASEEAGIKFKLVTLPENCAGYEICNVIHRFNADPSIHGILVQLPLPQFLLCICPEQHLDVAHILDVVTLEKDVDGFHPLNIANLAMRGMEPLFIPCTPKGCIELLLQSDVEIMGKKAVVIGRSNIVGLPTSLLLQRHHATVTILHPFTSNPQAVAREADILISAAGVPNLVRGNWLKPGAVVVDVGTNPIE
ncbi:hypothetical protein M569_06517, partial [Genlisea aurea]